MSEDDSPTPIVRRGQWFDEFKEGEVYGTPARTVTETDVVSFAALSGDWSSVHTDEIYARRTPFRRRIAHGMLMQAIASGLIARTGLFEGTLAALGGMSVNFRAPVFPGDTVRLELRVEELDDAPSKLRGKIRFSAYMLNQSDQTVCDGEWRMLLLRDRERNRRARAQKSEEQP